MSTITTPVITALISFAGVCVSVASSWVIARMSASKEVKRLRLQWEREDTLTAVDEFSAMASAVAVFSESRKLRDQYKAVAAVASLRAKASGQMAEKLDALYAALQEDNSRAINDALSQVIQERRERRRE